MAVNVQTTPPNSRHPPNWDKILWAPKKNLTTRKSIRFQDVMTDESDDNLPIAERTQSNRKESKRSSTTPTFDKKSIYKPVILKFDDDDE